MYQYYWIHFNTFKDKFTFSCSLGTPIMLETTIILKLLSMTPTQMILLKMFAPVSVYLTGVFATLGLGVLNMSSLPTRFCAIQCAMWKGGCLSSRHRLNTSDNYLLPGFLLVSPHNLCSYWSVSQLCRIIFLSQFPTPVPVMLNGNKFQWPQKLR